MATETCQVAATTAPDNWTLGAGASKVAAVAAPDDDDTTYINSGTSDETEQRFTVTPSAISVGDTITEIAIAARNLRDHGSNPTFVLGYTFTPNGGGTQTGESNDITSTTTWKTDTYTDSSLSVVWGSGLVVWIRNTLARNMRCSTLQITLTYTPAATTGAKSKVATVRLSTKVGGLLTA